MAANLKSRTRTLYLAVEKAQQTGDHKPVVAMATAFANDGLSAGMSVAETLAWAMFRIEIDHGEDGLSPGRFDDLRESLVVAGVCVDNHFRQARTAGLWAIGSYYGFLDNRQFSYLRAHSQTLPQWMRAHLRTIKCLALAPPSNRRSKSGDCRSKKRRK